MWASTFITLIFIAAELRFGGTGEQGMCGSPEPINNTKRDNYSSDRFRMLCEDGFVRKAGTSNLFICKQKETKYDWVNSPALICIPDPKLKPSMASATEKTWCTTTGTTKTSSTASGQTAFTTTHTVGTTTESTLRTTIRTTTKEANTITLSSSTALQVSENETSVSPQSTPPSNIITTTVNTSTQKLTPSTSSTTEKTWCTTMEKTNTTTTSEPRQTTLISDSVTGAVIVFILVIGALAGTLLWCQRRKKHCRTPHMTPDPVLPLLDRSTSPSNCPQDQNSYIIC